MKKPYYITTAIAYTSGKPHIGNIYEIVLSDALARFMRMYGYDVYFQTGTDEHGQKIQTKAEAAGVSPKEFVDKTAAEIRRNWDLMNTSYDKFVRTTDPAHEAQVQKIFKKLYEQGDIYKGEYEGMYCSPCEAFYTQSQLVDGKCPDCGGAVSYAKEEAYFFKLSKYAKQLEDYIAEHPDFIQPDVRKNEMLNNFIRPGLKDLCVSRTSFSWGIPVDFDPKHVVYVWIDALSNYITFLGYDADGNNGALYQKYWPADIHIIGKDILRFHTIYWPIMLMALGVPLPKKVFGHPWLLIGEGKMSKSKGNVIYADDLVDMFGVDAVRYYLLKEMPFAHDGSITYELMIERYNSDLVNIFGNLVNRTFAMVNQNFGPVVPAPCFVAAEDAELIGAVKALKDACAEKMHDMHISDALCDIFNVLRRCNKYIDETMPWALARDESKKARLGGVLYNLLESERVCAVLLGAFLPEASEKLIRMLNTKACGYDSLGTFDGMKAGDALNWAEILFMRIDPAKKLLEIQQSLGKVKTRAAKEKEPDVAAEADSGMITIEDFSKMKLVTGKIIQAEKHPKADRLYVLKVDTGEKIRTIVSGIAEHFTLEELPGRQVTVVSNLKPAVLRGIESEGMLLMAGSAGKLTIIAPETEILPGSTIK